MKTRWMMGIALLMVIGLIGGAVAQQQVIVMPGEIKWGEGPGSLPPGAKLAVIEGDLSKADVFTARLQFPANYKVPPHFHPGQERVTVISGTFNLGHGEKFDPEKMKALPAGSYSSLPPKTPHYAWFKEQTVIQISTMGPWGITYLNPADDPRQKK